MRINNFFGKLGMERDGALTESLLPPRGSCRSRRVNFQVLRRIFASLRGRRNSVRKTANLGAYRSESVVRAGLYSQSYEVDKVLDRASAVVTKLSSIESKCGELVQEGNTKAADVIRRKDVIGFKMYNGPYHFLFAAGVLSREAMQGMLSDLVSADALLSDLIKSLENLQSDIDKLRGQAQGLAAAGP